MSETVDEKLRESGWFPGRQTDSTQDLAALAGEGFEIWGDLRRFLAEYSGLILLSDDGTRSLWICAARSVREVDPEWCRAYSEAIKTPLAPVGGYSHMSIYVNPLGVFYGGFDIEYGKLATSFSELVNSLLVQYLSVSLDRRLN